MSPLVSWVGVALLGVSLVACGGGNDAGAGGGGPGGGGTPAAASSGPASASEAEALAFVREEEKLARDVYDALAGQDPVFTNIQRSEQMHMDAVPTLLERYGLRDPAAGAPVGEFENATLQGLHAALVSQGSTSRLAALAVGVEIEELDIHDIEALRAGTSRTDVLTVYDNLTRGSRNHLRSFHAQLTALGGTYTARHLDAATFQAIVSSPRETGGPGS